MRIARRELQKEDRFVAKNKKRVFIILEDLQDEISAYTKWGKLIGTFKFFAQDDGVNEWHLLQSMFLEDLPGYKGLGIGEEMLRRFKDGMSTVIVAEEDTGITNNLGSHLTGDGVGFVARMREKGLIAPSASERYDRMDEPDWDE